MNKGNINFDLANELESDRFVSGLVRSIRQTDQTNRESGFMVLRNPLSEELVSTSIYVDRPESIGLGVSYSLAAKRFYEETGLRVGNNQEAFFNFVRKKIKLPYPKRGYREVTDEDLNSGLYPVFNVHIHPRYNSTMPSQGDLIALNSKRRMFSNHLSAVNPISLIGAAKSYKSVSGKNMNQVIVIQEKTETPLDPEFVWKGSEKMYNDSDSLAIFRLMLYSGIAKVNCFLTDNYNIGLGALSRGDHKLYLNKFDSFCPVDRVDLEVEY